MIRSFLLVLFTAATAHAIIDFTPIVGERSLEGIKFKQLNFSRDGHRITYEQPDGWSYSGGGPSIKFVPPNVTQAQADISQLHLQSPQAYDEATLKQLKQQVLNLLPPGSDEVNVVSEQPNPIM